MVGVAYRALPTELRQQKKMLRSTQYGLKKNVRTDLECDVGGRGLTIEPMTFDLLGPEGDG